MQRGGGGGAWKVQEGEGGEGTERRERGTKRRGRVEEKEKGVVKEEGRRRSSGAEKVLTLFRWCYHIAGHDHN